MSSQKTKYDETSTPMPYLDSLPAEAKRHAEDVECLFDTWVATRSRNARLSTYYNMKNKMVDLGISIPPQLVNTNAVVGWAMKAVQVMAVRSKFDGFVFGGQTDASLDRLVRRNKLITLYQRACAEALTHGVAAFTVMKGGKGQPPVKVRTFSANQCGLLWDKNADRVGAGITLIDVDKEGRATRYVAHFDDCVLTFSRSGADVWSCEWEPNILGRPMIEPLVYDADDDRPLGRSRITPEVMGIIDKAMRDVLRMEVGAEFFTAPQRYVLGASEDIFNPVPDFEEDAPAHVSDTDIEGDDDAPVTLDADTEKKKRKYVASMEDRMRAYIGAWMAISRDENGDIPQVGQFPAGSAQNFISVFENDAQRFSGATNVPLAQLGVLSNTYTSSDALGAANNPLILDVERMNAAFSESMAEVARMMMAVDRGCSVDALPEGLQGVQAYFKDPAQPTISARADAWTKIGASDDGLVGTRIWYEGIGLPQATIDRIMVEKGQRNSIDFLNEIAEGLGKGGGPLG